MYHLLIVDDDLIIRRGLSRAIPWEEYGIQVAGVAGDGQTALEMMEEIVPDIVIADIRMPQIDGLEFAKLVRDRFPAVKVILLTAYKDFEYAKTALQLQVYDYVLKPVDNQALLEVVTRAALAKAEQQKVNRKLEESQPLLLRQFFLDLIEERFSPEEIRVKMELLEIEAFAPPLLVVVIKLVDYDRNLRFQKENLKEKLAEIITGLTQNGKVLIIDSGQDEMVLLYSAGGSTGARLVSDIGRLTEQIRQTAAEKFQLKVRIGIGKTYDSLLQAGRSYADACAVLEINHTLGKSMQKTLIGQAIDYITAHFSQPDLSLQEVAEAIHISPTYLSSIFKKEQGSNFSDFILELRMKKAKELLGSGVMKVYEVAEAVGYNNVHYFSACFKKYSGISPTDFKKS
jgi:two-component system response regulator YesN